MWQGTLSIQSCFPEGNSTPNSAKSQPSSPRSQPSTMVTIEMPPKNLASVAVLSQPSSRSVVSLQLPDVTNTVIAEISNMVPSEVTSGPASASLLTSPLGLLREKCTITKGQETVLHIAAGARQTKFVEELVKLMDMRDLELQNKHDSTTLCFAAASGTHKNC
ncbi:unnamed protein product [Camellia sinensis]